MPEPLSMSARSTPSTATSRRLFGVSLRVDAGQVVAVIGANGAGKSTLLKSIAGLMPARRDAILLRWRADRRRAAPTRSVGRGIALVPEGRRLFPSLSVEENLLIGGQLGRPGPWTLARIYALFPVLAERRHLPATALSGGQQQMVAIGRALMSNPQTAAVRRDQPRSRADRRTRHLCAAAGDRRRRAVADHRRAGHRAGAQSAQPGLLPAGRPRRAARRGARR